jgi:hypothetical protein
LYWLQENRNTVTLNPPKEKELPHTNKKKRSGAQSPTTMKQIKTFQQQHNSQKKV